MRKCIIITLLVFIIVFASCQYYSDVLLGVGKYATVKIQYKNLPPDTEIVDIGFLISDPNDEDFVSLDKATREWRWPEMTTQEDMNRFIDKHYEFGGDDSDGDNIIEGEIDTGEYSWLIYCEYENTTTSDISRFILMVHYHDINNLDSFLFEDGVEGGYHITIDLTEDRVVSIEPNYNDEVNLFNNVYAIINEYDAVSGNYNPYIYYDFIQHAQIIPNTTDDVNLTDIFVNDGVVNISANSMDSALYYKCTYDNETWNCEEIILEEQGSSAIIPEANAISVDIHNNNIVYVAGKSPNTDDILEPCIWEDGADITQTTLPTLPNFNFQNLVSSIFIENGDIYVTGMYESNNTTEIEYISTFFKNTSGDWSANTYYIGSDIKYYISTSIFSRNGDLYISEVYSNNDNYEAYYWNNDQQKFLDNGMAMDIYYSSNGNLYTVGQHDDPITPVPAYWVGDTLNELSSTKKGSATSLHVIENNDGTETLYIGGYIEDNTGYFKAVYWIVDVDTNTTEMIDIKDSNNNNIYVDEIYPDIYYFIKPVSIFVEIE